MKYKGISAKELDQILSKYDNKPVIKKVNKIPLTVKDPLNSFIKSLDHILDNHYNNDGSKE
jgi:hypothetical protein